MDNPGFALFVAVVDGIAVGIVNFENGSKKSIEHRGMLGISVKKNYRGFGIGQALMKTLLDWAEKNPLIQKVSLAVFANNEQAIRLYKQFGFQVEGRRLKEIKQPDGLFMDDLLMYRFVPNS